MSRSRDTVYCWAPLVAMALYMVALCLRAYDDMTGMHCLVFGAVYLPFFLLGLCPAWLANPAFLVAFVALAGGRGRKAAKWATAAVALAPTALMMGRPGPGFVMWVAAMATVLIAGAIVGDPPDRPDAKPVERPHDGER